jgi:hypothetical protein
LGGKLDLVRTFVACIDDSVWFVKVLDVLFPVVLGGDFWSSLGDFFGWFSGPFSWGFDGGNLWEPFVVLWVVIPLPNP